ncbi:hypothetical protein PV08_04888 [Exophiala spinifera]|uniref:Uncharacterized protein n=1 Tax=Exophiala spinifera TaxID=91928 RepID=A0A0D2BFB9_9EURO|nr:uncharacterized protein PV08_04888 [Exophiala spinifera]KIW17693.1 hypothetical protein PV08_04888 [Exophiala spinifera]
MLVQEMVLDNDSNQSRDIYGRHFVPMSKNARSDVSFPLAPPRTRAPSMASTVDLGEKDGQSMGVFTIRATDSPVPETMRHERERDNRVPDKTGEPRPSLQNLPLEVQGKILDFIFGDMHSVYAGSTSLRGKSVSSLMRHPRRKAVSDFALVSPTWRELVQERIYRHIKIKGTRAGLDETQEFFLEHMHLTKYVRHIEFWVPVWGDKASLDDHIYNPLNPLGTDRNTNLHLANHVHENLLPVNDFIGYSFKLCAASATLSQMFSLVNCFFSNARVFTLEGGHCKKSNMIRHFPQTLFPDPNQRLEELHNIRTFAMRGAWNIMRSYSHWKTIEAALPNVEEWHCGYAKPRSEADSTIDAILINLPPQYRHVNISLDGMYSKDPTTLGSSHHHGQSHLCERLGNVLPQLESLSYTGKVCDCLWSSAFSALSQSKAEPRLKALEIVVKSCCRQRVTDTDLETGETIYHEAGGAGITNLIFIRSFERLVMKTVEALPLFPQLNYVRIRFIDLDSPCTLLNPYWQLENGKVSGIWNEQIVERLAELRPDIGYIELSDGIEPAGWHKRPNLPTVTGTGGRHFQDVPTSPLSVTDAVVGNGCSLYPKTKPKSIKTSSYKLVAESRGS